MFRSLLYSVWTPSTLGIRFFFSPWLTMQAKYNTGGNSKSLKICYVFYDYVESQRGLSGLHDKMIFPKPFSGNLHTLNCETQQERRNSGKSRYWFILVLHLPPPASFFSPHPWPMEVSTPRFETVPQQWPELLQWLCLILNPLRHQGTPYIFPFLT